MTADPSKARSSPRRLILGTAGHIDHGKTALVKRLTGTDTDRLEEEKRRGITIELGFARYEPRPGITFGVVDVPGHEAFVRTMAAGAAGMDVVLLAVAADESVMPQTREHVAIVRLLNVRSMVVALSKADLVDDEWLKMVEEDIRELLDPTSFREAEVVPVSAVTGAGLNRLSRALARAASNAGERRVSDLARLPVDRVFTAPGTGTVATGTLWSGTLATGDSVRALPSGGEARIRAIEVHGEAAKRASAGQRTALALTGEAARRGAVQRGETVVSSPAWRSSMMLSVLLSVLENTGWRVKAGQRVRLHLGTREILARLWLFGESEAPPGADCFAQLRLEAPVVARWGDRFALRSYSPLTTIAGGMVLEPDPPKRKRLGEEERTALARLARSGEASVLGAAQIAGMRGVSGRVLQLRSDATVAPSKEVKGVVVRYWRDRRFHVRAVEEAERIMLERTRRFHEDHPLQEGISLPKLRDALPPFAHPAMADGVIERLKEAGKIEVARRFARIRGFVPTPSPEEAELMEALGKHIRSLGPAGPSTEDLPAELLNRKGVRRVLAYMERSGRIERVGDAFWVDSGVLESLCRAVRARLSGRSGLGPADFRETLQTSRKRLIPLLSRLDDLGVTHRGEDGLRRVDPERAGA